MQVIIARELQAIARPRKRALGNDLCGSGKGDGQIQSHARLYATELPLLRNETT
jgi:hypothetical protein